MGGRMSKSKGAGFERMICQRLSLWVSGLTRNDVFWRSAMSGGRATIMRQQHGVLGNAMAGDIAAIHPDGSPLVEHFFVECKRYAKLGFENIPYGGTNCRFFEFVRVCWQESRATKKKPFLIVREDRREELVALDSEGVTILGLSKDVCRMFCKIGKDEVFIYAFSDLLTGIKFSDVRRRLGWRKTRMKIVKETLGAERMSCFLHGDYEGSDCPTCRTVRAGGGAGASKSMRKRVWVGKSSKRTRVRIKHNEEE